MLTVFDRINNAKLPPVVVAEVSANHNGSIDRAKEIIEVAAEAGAHAIKLQTYTADTITIDSDQKDFVINDAKSLWNGRKLHGLYQEAHTPWEWHEELFQFARTCGLDIFSTPFDFTAVDFLMKFDPSCFKIASFEMTHWPLLEKVAKTKKPVVMSSGMSTIEELRDSIKVLRENGCQDLIVLKCTSAYPAPVAEMNLSALDTIANEFNIPVGLSDHTLDHTSAIVAVSRGARLIEKHFTVRRSDGGPDSAFSIEPKELAELVKVTAEAWESLGDGVLHPGAKELASRAFRQSVYIVKDVAAGEQVTAESIRIIRPGFGLEPKFYKEVLGKTFTTPQKRGTALTKEMLK